MADCYEHGVCVGQIQAKSGLTQSTVSEYLSILQRAGFIESKRVGQWTYYKRNEKAFTELSKIIESNI
jgi:ArsR family transcriptional regulator